MMPSSEASVERTPNPRGSRTALRRRSSYPFVPAGVRMLLSRPERVSTLVRVFGFSPGSTRRWLNDLLDAGLRDEWLSLTELTEQYLEAHVQVRDARTIRTLRQRMKRPLDAFGGLELRDLEKRAREIATWQATLPEGSRYGIMQAFRQTLEAGVRWKLIRENPAKLAGPYPQPHRSEIVPFTIKAIAGLALELGPPYGPLVVFAAETGLRPSEWIAIQHADIHRDDGVLVIERSVSRGRLKAYGKTARSRRRVPLSRRAVDALDLLPRRLDTRLVFPSPRGKHLDLENWRRRDWRPALDAAGIPSRRIYDLRHTFATHALAAGLSIFEVARFMGTSVRVIDSTYGHLAHGSEQLARERLDVWALNGRGGETGTQ